MAMKETFLSKLQNLADEINKRYAQKSDVSEYSISRKATAEEGYSASYALMKNGAPAGDVINIPKDYLVKSAVILTCTQANSPVEGLSPGDKYVDFTVNTVTGDGNESHLYLPLKDIAPGYTPGNGIKISASNEVSVKIDEAGANGLSVDAAGLKMATATQSSAGAMSAADKQRLDSALTEQDLADITPEEISSLFD